MISQANLLIDLNSFSWNDLSINRSTEIDNLILAVDKIEDNDDTVFNHPESFNYKLDWGYFHELQIFDDELRGGFVPWLTHDHQTFLRKLFRRPISSTPSLTLTQLAEEFPGENNGLLRCGGSDEAQCVKCETTWYELHSLFVNGNLSIQDIDAVYFKQFYKPRLLVSANSIRERIRTGQEHPIFKRLDVPQSEDGHMIHNQKIHIHFNENDSALNIDGTWKHPSCNIPKEAIETLKQWGFLLP